MTFITDSTIVLTVDVLMVGVFGVGPLKTIFDSIFLVTFLTDNTIVLIVDVLIVGVF
jgi:hypothetical protein